jgi:hypothetical protein
MTDTTLAERLARCVKPLEWHPTAKGWMRAEGFGCEYHAEEGGDTCRAEEGHRARILAALDMDALAREVEAMVGAEKRKMLRQAMAAYASAWNEPDRDEETDEEARRITALWFSHWMKDNYPTSHEHAAHSGDCTKQPWSCLRCHADEWLADSDAALDAWEAAAIRAREGGRP